MPVTAECPYCAQKVLVSGEATGRPVRCPACQATFPRPAGLTQGAFQAEAPGPVPVARRAARLPDEDEGRPARRAPRPSSDDRGGGNVALVLGVVALALGVLALLISWIPFVGLLGLFGSVPGLALGVVGMVLASGRARPGMGVALAGATVSLVALLAAGTVTVVAGILAPDLQALDVPKADAPRERPVEKLAAWGDVIDPDRDCTVRQEQGAVTITVPATPHDLSTELGRLNSPRVLQDVEGDFTAQVKVCGALRPSAPGTIPGRVPFQSGGLLLWRDSRNYVRLERAAFPRGGGLNSYLSLELRTNAVSGPNPTAPLGEKDTYLRLERRGDRLTGSASQDGRSWTTLPPLSVALPAKVRVGIATVNAARQPLTLRFEEFRVSR